MVRTVWILGASLVLTSVAGAAPDPWDESTPRAVSSDLKAPMADVGNPGAKVVLPPVPVFELPVAPAGTVGVRELLVAGKPLLGTDVKVNGYVTAIYDCV